MSDFASLGDIAIRTRLMIERLGQGAGKAAMPRALEQASAPAAPVVASDWWMASAALDDQVTRQLIATQADQSVDPNTDPGTDGTAPDPAASSGDGSTDPAPSQVADNGGAPSPSVGTNGPSAPVDPSSVDPSSVDPTSVAPGPATPSAPDPSVAVDPSTPSAPAPTPAVPATPAPPAPQGAVAALDLLFKAQAQANDPASQYKQALFTALDTNADGMVSSAELQQAVLNGGGTTASAAALCAQLDPNGTGCVHTADFVTRLPAPSFEDFDLTTGAFTPAGPTAGDAVGAIYLGTVPAAGQPKQVSTPTANPLSPFDIDRNGSIDLHELMAAVRGGGGSDAAATLLFAQLDPQGTGAVTAQQLNANMPAPTLDLNAGTVTWPDPLVQDGMQALMNSLAAASAPLPTAERQLFTQLDSNGDGIVTADDISQAVTSAGGAPDDASSLYAQLDPDQTGGITMEQFMANLPPVNIDANGVVTVQADQAGMPSTQTAAATPTAPQSVPLPQSLSSGMMSVLLQMQAGFAA